MAAKYSFPLFAEPGNCITSQGNQGGDSCLVAQAFQNVECCKKTAIGLRSQLSYLPDAACPSTTSLSSDEERRTYPKLLKPGGTLTLKVSGLKVCNQTRPLSP